MKKTVFFWLYFIVSIILATYFASRVITSNMGRGPISEIKRIRIINNAKDFDIEPIRMAIGIQEKTKIKSVDLHLINNRIMDIPGIKGAATRRLPNGNLIIKTQKYDVVAMWSDGVYYYPLSADGTKIEKPSSERTENTLVFQGNDPNDLKKIDLKQIIDGVSVLSSYIDYLTIVESRRWNIHTKNGITIYLPENNPIDAINKINILNQTHNLLSRQIDVLDMRDNARILVKTTK
ncbi:MAG: cell division protein FtsQ/DivIB [Alphaproteobacteria bacterium]|nr:cell division protein FtsQ/DivIB [Alphaproteobacteria bacterium]